MTFTIRPAVPGDESAVVELLLAQFADHQIPTTREALDAAVPVALRDASLGFIFLAVNGDQAIGVAVCSLSWTLEHGGLAAYMDELFIMEAYRGQGIGSALIQQVLSKAQSLGCQAVDLEVDIEHKRVEDLYKRHGFEYLPRSRWVRYLYNTGNNGT